MTEVKPVEVGDVVRVVNETREVRNALVTIVHGVFTDSYAPCINVVYLSADETKRDPYGRQVERLSSLQHLSQGPDQMPNPGRYWENL